MQRRESFELHDCRTDAVRFDRATRSGKVAPRSTITRDARDRTRVHHAGEPEDEAAVKAEAMAIVAQAKKDIKLREEARGEMKKASTKDDIQALINKRLAQSFADRPKAPEKPKEAPKPVKEAPKEAPPDPEATKKEAAAIVAAANKDYKQRLADREKAKTATAEDLQAMINAKLNISK